MALFARRRSPVEWRTCSMQQIIDPDLQDAARQFPRFCREKYTAIIGAQDGNSVYLDLSTAPHVLICGGTGSGKSVCLNAIICQLLLKSSPARLRLYMVDPKRVELARYRDLPHLAAPIATDATSALQVLERAEAEMQRRFSAMDAAGVLDIDDLDGGTWGRVLVVVDEFASLSDSAGRETLMRPLREVARQGRAAGVHLILATQYPTAKVIDTQIRSNCPTRICFRLNTATESRTAIDTKGAELLRGRGDGLHRSAFGELVHFQGLMCSPEQIKTIVDHYKAQQV